METFRLNQWAVTVNGEVHAMFTEPRCSEELAMAIAVETFGNGITELVDEGGVKRALTNAQYHIANKLNCAECGMYKSHEETCSKLSEVN
jgi:hypothetical protein